ncbi:actin-domain-containing protein [Scenedesmus sp. NREL 46B-D3]|nr:actin-domain-containing protein [Scenedesmus sp. NREL 46B-D3]
MDALQQQQQQQYGEVPLYPCPAFAAVLRPPRCSYDAAALAGRALVIDNGSHSMRTGWAGEEAPAVVFRAAMCKPRPKQGAANRAVVGEWGPGLSGWDFGKHTHRYAHESDVPTNLETQEAITDWALDRMGLAEAGCVDHPLLMTEAPLMPNSARSQLAQLLFEAYGVPALSYVAAAPAAFYHHYSRHHLLQQQAQQQQQQQQQQQNGWAALGLQQSELQQLLQQTGSWQEAYCGSSSGLVVCSGNSSTYVVPIYKGQPQWSAAMRCWAGGAACTGHLQQLLGLQAPAGAGGLLGNWQLLEALKEGFCFAAGDYRQQLRAAADQPHTAGGLAVRVQLPFVAPTGPTKPSPLDLAVRAQQAKARGKALAEQRRFKVLEEKEEQLAALRELQAGQLVLLPLMPICRLLPAAVHRGWAARRTWLGRLLSWQQRWTGELTWTAG